MGGLSLKLEFIRKYPIPISLQNDVLILRIWGKLFNRYWGLEGTRGLFKKRKNWFPNMFWPLWPDILHSLLILSWRKCQNMVKILEVLSIPLHLELHLEVMVSITLKICLEWKKLTRTSLVGYDVNRNI